MRWADIYEKRFIHYEKAPKRLKHMALSLNIGTYHINSSFSQRHAEMSAY